MLQFAGYNMVASGKKIKISLEYSGNVVNIECEQYKPIKSLKEKAGKIFYPLNSDTRLVYNNKDLTPYETVALGDFFKNKTNIHIKVFQMVNFNAKEQNVSYANLSNSPNVNFKSFGGNVVSCSCGNDSASYYCRTDMSFICKNCRMNKTYKNQSVIFFDIENIEESLKFYIKTLHSDLNHSVKSCKKYSENSKNSKLLDPQSRKEMIIRRLDEIEKRQQDILKSLPLAENNSVFFEEVEDKAILCNKDLEQLQESIHKIFLQDKTAGFNKTSSFYKMIGEMEKEVNRINEAVVNYKVNFDVNRKFDDMYKMLEKALDSVYYYDYNLKNLVDDTTLEAYEKMIGLREKSPIKKGDYSSSSNVTDKGIENKKMSKSLSSDYAFLEDADKDPNKKKDNLNSQKEKVDKNKVEDKIKSQEIKDGNIKNEISNKDPNKLKENKQSENKETKNLTNNTKVEDNKNNIDSSKTGNKDNQDPKKNDKNNVDPTKDLKQNPEPNKDPKNNHKQEENKNSQVGK